MKHEFREDRAADCRDLVDAPDQSFDWGTLYSHLGEDARDGDNDPRLAEAVTRVLQMFIPVDNRKLRLRDVGLRVIGLAWVLNPAYFARSPSLRELAGRCHVKAATLARITGELSRSIGWRNRAQRHAWNWHRSERPPLDEGNDAGTVRLGKAGASACERPPDRPGRLATPSAE